MNVIYFFIVLFLINSCLFLTIQQTMKFIKNKKLWIKITIFLVSELLFTIITALIYFGMIGWNTTTYKEYFEFKVSPEREKMYESKCLSICRFKRKLR